MSDLKSHGPTQKYVMPISRLTVDKLGVKLYDRVSAVLAELIANAYDADASEVVVHAPMGRHLATSSADGIVHDKGFEIKITDDGCGMTPEDLQQLYLPIGTERRDRAKNGDVSPQYGRKVMGRKGVGKLAPFGICKRIEIISSGGEQISTPGGAPRGYSTSHIIMNYIDMVVDVSSEYEPEIGQQDRSLSERTGTTIILSDFNHRVVPPLEVLSRQISQRFGIASDNWRIILHNSDEYADTENKEIIVGTLSIDAMPNTRIEFPENRNQNTPAIVPPSNQKLPNLEAGFDNDGKWYPIHGWVAYSRSPYRDELMAGVRIYCRGKITAQTSIFGRGAGFTGEHSVRSYLVGELHADWLDETEDLILTDRRDILWSHPLGEKFQAWGQTIVKTIGVLSREPLRKSVKQTFFDIGRIEERIANSFPDYRDKNLRERATKLAEQIGRAISKQEAEDESIVADLVDLVIEFAPHLELGQLTQAASGSSSTTLHALIDILRAARVAETFTLGRLMQDRLRIIGTIENLISHTETKEGELQDLIADNQWLINPAWLPLTANKGFARVRMTLEKYLNEQISEQSISLQPFEHGQRRPDFILTTQEGILQLIEIKAPGHRLTDQEIERIAIYKDEIEKFLAANEYQDLLEQLSAYHIILVCDGTALTTAYQQLLSGWISAKTMTHLSWGAFVERAVRQHRAFSDLVDGTSHG